MRTWARASSAALFARACVQSTRFGELRRCGASALGLRAPSSRSWNLHRRPHPGLHHCRQQGQWPPDQQLRSRRPRPQRSSRPKILRSPPMCSRWAQQLSRPTRPATYTSSCWCWLPYPSQTIETARRGRSPVDSTTWSSRADPESTFLRPTTHPTCIRTAARTTGVPSWCAPRHFPLARLSRFVKLSSPRRAASGPRPGRPKVFVVCRLDVGLW